jgi:hypothetical protein|tara:strand:+ start:344 stop:697 length:354 start_codon:yes stop_codon:yes gene_type:complete
MTEEKAIELTEEMVLNALQSKRIKDKYSALAVAAAAANNNGVMIGLEQSDMREGDKFVTQSIIGLSLGLCARMADPTQPKNLYKQLSKVLGQSIGYKIMEEFNMGRGFATNLGAEEK